MPAQILPVMDMTEDNLDQQRMLMRQEQMQQQAETQAQLMQLRQAKQQQDEQIAPLQMQLLQTQIEKERQAMKLAGEAGVRAADLDPLTKDKLSADIEAVRRENLQRRVDLGASLQKFDNDQVNQMAKQRLDTISELKGGKEIQELTGKIAQQRAVTYNTLMTLPDWQRGPMVKALADNGYLKPNEATTIMDAPSDPKTIMDDLARTLGQDKADEYNAALKVASTPTSPEWGQMDNPDMAKFMMGFKKVPNPAAGPSPQVQALGQLHKIMSSYYEVQAMRNDFRQVPAVPLKGGVADPTQMQEKGIYKLVNPKDSKKAVIVRFKGMKRDNTPDYEIIKQIG